MGAIGRSGWGAIGIIQPGRDVLNRRRVSHIPVAALYTAAPEVAVVRSRPNVACLTPNQLHDLREAWAALYALPAAHPHSFLRIAGYHGEPVPYYCRHGSPGFLTWHRAYLLVFEQALQAMNPGVMLPYWNWSSGPTTGVPAPCREPTYVNRDGDTVPNPLYSGPLPAGAPATSTARRSDIDTTTFGDLATSAQTALGHADFALFQSSLNGVHGSVHIRVGGHMSGVDWAGYDPIFHLHHANVDRLWALWQSTHADPLPSTEAALPLDPFTRPCSSDFFIGSEMASTEALGYRYRNFCLFPFPIPIWEVVRIPSLPDWVHTHLRRARLVLNSTRMASRSAELRVFVNERDANEKTPVEDNPRLAARAGVFGMRGDEVKGGGRPPHPHDGHEHHGHHGAHGRDVGAARTGTESHTDPHGAHPLRHGEHFDLAIDITAALRRALEKEREVTITVVAVDSEGRRVRAEELNFEDAELHVEQGDERA